jgi:hypothetical protein
VRLRKVKRILSGLLRGYKLKASCFARARSRLFGESPFEECEPPCISRSCQTFITINAAEQLRAHQVVTVRQAQLGAEFGFVCSARQRTPTRAEHLKERRDQNVFRRWRRRRIGESEDVGHLLLLRLRSLERCQWRLPPLRRALPIPRLTDADLHVRSVPKIVPNTYPATPHSTQRHPKAIAGNS